MLVSLLLLTSSCSSLSTSRARWRLASRYLQQMYDGPQNVSFSIFFILNKVVWNVFQKIASSSKICSKNLLFHYAEFNVRFFKVLIRENNQCPFAKLLSAFKEYCTHNYSGNQMISDKKNKVALS